MADFDPNWAFPDYNSSLNSPMSLKWCTQLDVVQKRCPIVFQSHPSNFEVTQDKKLTTLTRIERFRTVTSVRIHQWIEMMHKAWCNIEELPYRFLRSSINCQGHTGWKIDDLDQIWAILLGRSQLSNLLDLPSCYYYFIFDNYHLGKTLLIYISQDCRVKDILKPSTYLIIRTIDDNSWAYISLSLQ